MKAAFSLSSPGVRKTELPEASRVRDQSSRLGVLHQCILQARKRLVVQIRLAMAFKGGELDEYGLH